MFDYVFTEKKKKVGTDQKYQSSYQQLSFWLFRWLLSPLPQLPATTCKHLILVSVVAIVFIIVVVIIVVDVVKTSTNTNTTIIVIIIIIIIIIKSSSLL